MQNELNTTPLANQGSDPASSTWNLDYLIDYMAKKGHSREFLEQGVDEYKRYINICIAHPDQAFPISRAVDEIWHTHILFTRDYFAMCEALGISYLHHSPSTSEEDRQSYKADYALFRRIYAETYGEGANPEFWPTDLESGDSRCADCVQGTPTKESLAN